MAMVSKLEHASCRFGTKWNRRVCPHGRAGLRHRIRGARPRCDGTRRDRSRHGQAARRAEAVRRTACNLARIMSSRTIAACAVALATCVASVAACHKSSEHEAEEAAKAAAVAAEKEQRAFKELERGETSEAARALVESQKAKEKAAAEQADVAEATRREQDRYRALLTKEIAWIDRRVAQMSRDAVNATGEVRAEKEADVASAREWRDRLSRDLDAIDHPPAGTEWPAIKTRIERNLDEDRPLSIPRSFEKSYGI
jgi:UPF0755 protein